MPRKVSVAVAFVLSYAFPTVGLAAPDIDEPVPAWLSFSPDSPIAIDEGAFKIKNSGGSPLVYSVANVDAWLRVAPVAGQLAPGQSIAVAVEAVCQGCVESLDTQIFVNTNDPDEPQKKIAVHLDCPPFPVPPGGSSGDPHIVTLDGLAYDFQAEGDYVLAASANGAMEIQSRQEFMLGQTDVSTNTQIGVRVADEQDPQESFDHVIVSLGEPPVVDGVVFAEQGWLHLPHSGGMLVVNGPRTTIFWPAGDVLVLSEEPTHINVSLSPSESRVGTMRGLLGDFDGDRGNDIRTREGAVLPQPVADKALFEQFGASWSVGTDDELWLDEFAVEAAPSTPIYPTDLPSDEFAAARDACVAEGVVNVIMADACAYDTVVMETPPEVEACQQDPIERMGPCCKVCRTGKACGNSCISAAKSCHRSPGCACQGP